ncbi:hypothetical protein, variant 1 [Sphaeroforma arctica JP610]|uniref:RING-type E3 ubiquitin transferase n=1 Tax=Sphaeroforma arctica JP610 TaxID=667725 RepID=A0A0L0G8M9_9EUKA|nr:hypothetical protein, variant 1 [Sphaeroforma arctica JP610]KNC85365.1 hypothetical protein, variant 1 [Sphaeroforma arctica JP610]|eukprot:XP_014159268.1 hypothetical protein, variant 1 [Sphaeroforma arctica JP610]
MYEVTLVTSGIQQIGWATIDCIFSNEHGVGDEVDSFSYDGCRLKKWNVKPEPYGEAWVQGDTLGMMLDCDNGQISYCRNGKSLGVAFSNIRCGERGLAFFPALSMSHLEKCDMNFGHKPFRYPMAGYRPLQVQTASVAAVKRNSAGSRAFMSGNGNGPGGRMGVNEADFVDLVDHSRWGEPWTGTDLGSYSEAGERELGTSQGDVAFVRYLMGCYNRLLLGDGPKGSPPTHSTIRSTIQEPFHRDVFILLCQIMNLLIPLLVSPVVVESVLIPFLLENTQDQSTIAESEGAKSRIQEFTEYFLVFADEGEQRAVVECVFKCLSNKTRSGSDLFQNYLNKKSCGHGGGDEDSDQASSNASSTQNVANRAPSVVTDEDMLTETDQSPSAQYTAIGALALAWRLLSNRTILSILQRSRAFQDILGGLLSSWQPSTADLQQIYTSDVCTSQTCKLRRDADNEINLHFTGQHGTSLCANQCEGQCARERAQQKWKQDAETYHNIHHAHMVRLCKLFLMDDAPLADSFQRNFKSWSRQGPNSAATTPNGPHVSSPMPYLSRDRPPPHPMTTISPLMAPLGMSTVVPLQRRSLEGTPSAATPVSSLSRTGYMSPFPGSPLDGPLRTAAGTDPAAYLAEPAVLGEDPENALLSSAVSSASGAYQRIRDAIRRRSIGFTPTDDDPVQTSPPMDPASSELIPSLSGETFSPQPTSTLAAAFALTPTPHDATATATIARSVSPVLPPGRALANTSAPALPRIRSASAAANVRRGSSASASSSGGTRTALTPSVVDSDRTPISPQSVMVAWLKEHVRLLMKRRRHTETVVAAGLSDSSLDENLFFALLTIYKDSTYTAEGEASSNGIKTDTETAGMALDLLATFSSDIPEFQNLDRIGGSFEHVRKTEYGEVETEEDADELNDQSELMDLDGSDDDEEDDAMMDEPDPLRSTRSGSGLSIQRSHKPAHARSDADGETNLKVDWKVLILHIIVVLFQHAVSGRYQQIDCNTKYINVTLAKLHKLRQSLSRNPSESNSNNNSNSNGNNTKITNNDNNNRTPSACCCCACSDHTSIDESPPKTYWAAADTLLLKDISKHLRMRSWQHDLLLHPARRAGAIYFYTHLLTLLGKLSASRFFTYIPEIYAECSISSYRALASSIGHTLIQDQRVADCTRILLRYSLNFRNSPVTSPSLREMMLKCIGFSLSRSGYRELCERDEVMRELLVKRMLESFKTRLWILITPIFIRFYFGETMSDLDEWIDSEQSCESAVYQTCFAETCANTPALAVEFANHTFNHCNWAVSELCVSLQSAMKRLQTGQYYELQDCRSLQEQTQRSMVFSELTLSLFRLLEMTSRDATSVFTTIGGVATIQLVELVAQLISRAIRFEGLEDPDIKAVIVNQFPALLKLNQETIFTVVVRCLLNMHTSAATGGGKDPKSISIIDAIVTYDTAFAKTLAGLLQVRLDTGSAYGQVDENEPSNEDAMDVGVVASNGSHKDGGYSTPGGIQVDPLLDSSEHGAHATVDADKLRSFISDLNDARVQLEAKGLAEDEDDEDTCSICYTYPLSATFLPCRHQSCHQCITRHLLNSKECFFCKELITSIEHLT